MLGAPYSTHASPSGSPPPAPPSPAPSPWGGVVLAGAGVPLSCGAFMHSWVSAVCGCFLAPIPQLGLPLCPPQLARLWGGGCARSQLPCAGVGGSWGVVLCPTSPFSPSSAQWVAQRFPIIF